MGLTSVSEDSSETSFLLVENYNYDHSLWSSDRMGIFGPKSVLEEDTSFHYFLSFMDGREEEIQVEEPYSSMLDTVANSVLQEVEGSKSHVLYRPHT